MSLDLSRFQAASKAAEGWLTFVDAIAWQGEGGNVDGAYALLLPTKDGGRNLRDWYVEHIDVLNETQGALAICLSDGPVRREAGPPVWSSAHEAAAGMVRLTLDLLVAPLDGITDAKERWNMGQRLLTGHWRKLVITPLEVAAWKERIRRERAVIKGQYTTSPHASNGRRAKKHESGTVNQRMLEQLHEEPESVHWSQRRWAEWLGCGPTAVNDAAAWQTIKDARILEQARRRG